MKLRKILFYFLVVLLVVFVGIQFVPVEMENPPETSPLVVDDPQVAQILAASCNDCHTNNTHWPWYSAIAPVSWLVAHDVEEGREHLNFSTFGELEPSRAAHKMEEVAEEVEEGEMPLGIYVWLHPEAALTPDQVETLVKWAKEQEAALGGH